MSEKHTLLLVSTLIADAIVLAGMGAAAFFAVRALNAKVRAAQRPEAPDPLRPVLYLAGAMFWPVALALGMAKLGKDETVRTARVLLCIALGYFGFAAVVAVAIVTVVAVNPPAIVLELLP